MIITECLECDAPLMVPIDDAHLGEWQRVECDQCGSANYVEHRRCGGLTVNEEAFEELRRTGKRPAPGDEPPRPLRGPLRGLGVSELLQLVQEAEQEEG